MDTAPDVDVLVVGAGAAGMTVALAAHAVGLRVLLVESTSQVGGTTSVSAGTLWLPCADVDAAALPACRQSAREYLQACIGPGAHADKIDALLTSGSEVLRFLRERTQVRLDSVAVHPDYLQSLPGASLGGRAFAPREFDGRLLGRQFARVRGPLPEFLVLGGMMVSKTDIPLLLAAHREAKAFRHAVMLVARYARDRLRGYGRGTRLVMGNALVAQLFASVQAAGIRILFETTTALARDAQGLSCTLCSASSEQTLRVDKGVVLATGGFSGSAAMRERWLPSAARTRTVAHTGNAGGGIALGESLGAAIEADHAQPAFWMPVSTMRRPDGSLAIFPHIVLDRAKPGSLAVDGQGRRFTNEADSYHHFCEAMLRSSQAQPGQRFFMVADLAFVRSYGLGLIRPGGDVRKFSAGGYLVQGSTPRELARKLGLDVDTFTATLQRYNEQATRGEDLDFQRGESALNRHNGDAARAPNACLRPLYPSELCALEFEVADLATSVGLATDAQARVLDAAGQPIPGLYACGNDMASMMRGAYPGPGTTLGPGMTFAWRAVQHLAAGSVR